MAEFCEKCSEELGFPKEDFNTDQIFGSLMDEHWESVLCEGCAMLGVARVKDTKYLIYNQADLDRIYEIIVSK